MKHKTRLLILTVLSSIITVIFYYMTYIFNPKYSSMRKILYVSDYRDDGGQILILLLLGLLLLFALMFIVYAIKDSKKLEMFDQSGKPEFYNRNNLFSPYRIFQFYVLVSGFFVLIRDSYRVYSYEGSTQALYLFKTDVLFAMWDTIFILFIILTITLIIEYINNLKTITQ